MSLCDMMWQPIGVHRATGIVSALLSCLVELHDRGELHGHLHPELILLRTDAEGREVAELLPVEAVVCSLDGAERASIYRAPEQLLGSAVTPAADLHAVGVILYEMLTGQAPWRLDDPIARVEQQLEEPLPPLPPHAKVLEPLLRDLTAKDPALRCGSAREALRRLHAVAAATPPPPSTPALVVPPPLGPSAAIAPEASAPIELGTRRRWVAPVALLGVAAAIVVTWVARSEPPTESQGEIAPAAIAPPTVEPVAEDTPELEDHPLAARVEEELPPPPQETGKSRTRRRAARTATPVSEEVFEDPGPELDAEPEPEPAPEPPPRISRPPVRHPGTAMSTEEAEAWSRTRGGVPLQSFRKRRRVSAE